MTDEAVRGQPAARPGRVLALDVGTRRLGVAVSDPTGTLASPLATIQRATPDADAAALRRLADEHDAPLLLVGLPLTLDGRESTAARDVRAYTATLTPHLPTMDVRFTDERLSTVAAERHLAGQGVRGPRRRQVVDQVAATVFLQTWLDRQAGAQQRTAAARPDHQPRPRGGDMGVPG